MRAIEVGDLPQDLDSAFQYHLKTGQGITTALIISIVAGVVKPVSIVIANVTCMIAPLLLVVQKVLVFTVIDVVCDSIEVSTPQLNPIAFGLMLLPIPFGVCAHRPHSGRLSKFLLSKFR